VDAGQGGADAGRETTEPSAPAGTHGPDEAHDTDRTPRPVKVRP